MSSSDMTPRNIRHDMVSSAVSFLQDAKVQQSSVSQRVSFLESKGLTPDEIDEALRQTGSAMTAQAGPSQYAMQPPQRQQPFQSPAYYNPTAYGQPAQQNSRYDRDWRDWFIMAVVSGTIGYGLIGLARKYLMPHLQPPNQTILEADRDALTAKYDEVAAQLAVLDAETKAVKAGVETQRAAIEASIEEVESTVKALRDADKRRADDMDAVKSEVDTIKSSLTRMFDKTKEAQTASLAELQNELKSLKSLLVSSRNTSGGGGGGAGAGSNTPLGRPYSPFAANTQPLNVGTTGAAAPASAETGASSAATNSPARPSIPAWQLADTSSSTPKTTEEAKTTE